MTPELAPAIRIAFNHNDADLAYRVVAALLDMTMTNLGATVEELELAAIGVFEIIDAVASVGNIDGAEVVYDGDRPIIRLRHSARDVAFEAGAMELARTAFPTVISSDGLIEIHTLAGTGGPFV